MKYQNKLSNAPKAQKVLHGDNRLKSLKYSEHPLHMCVVAKLTLFLALSVLCPSEVHFWFLGRIRRDQRSTARKKGRTKKTYFAPTVYRVLREM